MFVHDDTPRIKWRLAVIEGVNKEAADGLIQFADIRTSTGRTNRPIAHLYPLEAVSDTARTISQMDSTEITSASTSNIDVPEPQREDENR